MALFKEVKSLQMIPSYLVQPLKANAPTHLATSRMELLARLLRDLGTAGSGFTVDDVMKVSASHAARRVRCSAGPQNSGWCRGGCRLGVRRVNE